MKIKYCASFLRSTANMYKKISTFETLMRSWQLQCNARTAVGKWSVPSKCCPETIYPKQMLP